MILIADSGAVSFTTLFPDFISKVQSLSSALVPVAAVLCFAGLIFATLRFMQGDHMTLYKKLVAVAVIAVAIGSIWDWTSLIKDGVSDLVVNQLQADPSDVSNRFSTLLSSPLNQTGNGWWDAIFSPATTVADGISRLLIWIIGKTAWLIMWWSRLAQTAILYFALSLAPLFLGMYAIDAMKQVAFRWTLGMISVCIWPLGWAVADLMTDGLLKNAANHDLIIAYGGTAAGGLADQGNAVATYIFIIAASIWIIFSTIAAPVIISKSIVSGGMMIGAQLMSGAASAGQAAASKAAGMAAGGASGAGVAGGAAGGAGAGSSAAGAGAGGGGGATASAGSAKVSAAAPATPTNVNAAAAAAAATI